MFHLNSLSVDNIYLLKYFSKLRKFSKHRYFPKLTQVASASHARGGPGAGRALDGVLSSCPIVVVSQKVATTIGKLYYTVPGTRTYLHSIQRNCYNKCSTF